MKKYLQVSKNFLISTLTYRAELFLWVFVDVARFLVYPFIWLAVYASGGAIDGYSPTSLITYYIIVAIINILAFSRVGYDMRRQIMNGSLSQYLIKPINYLVQETLGELSYKFGKIIITLFAAIIAAIFFPKYLPLPGFTNLCAFLFALILTFAISHGFQLLIGLTTFWLGENEGIGQFQGMLENVFAGEIAPLTFFPGTLQSLAFFLPFQYLTYFPAQIYLGTLKSSEILHGFGASILWIAVLYTAVVLVWKRGIKRYDGSSM